MTENSRDVDYTSVMGTHGDDIIQGTSGPDFINGRSGDDVIQGNGGNDILTGADGADRFTYATIPNPDGHTNATQDHGVDTISDFSRVEGDQIDLSGLASDTPNGLTFSGTTLGAYSVYYSVGVESAYDVVTGTDLALFTDGTGVTLMADLNGDPTGGPELTVAVWGWFGEPLTHISASDLIL